MNKKTENKVFQVTTIPTNEQLQNLSKSDLLDLILQLTKPKPAPRFRKPIPIPRRSVKEMVRNYVENIIEPPLEFRDDCKPIPAPRN